MTTREVAKLQPGTLLKGPGKAVVEFVKVDQYRRSKPCLFMFRAYINDDGQVIRIDKDTLLKCYSIIHTQDKEYKAIKVLYGKTR